MWYRAEISEAPNDDTEDQLAEWSIRDHAYLSNPKITARTNNQIPDNELVTLINYDVSNVDNLYLPVAMQVLDAWVVPQKTTGTGAHPNRDGWEPGKLPEVNGWTGSIDKIDFLQQQIRAFTATPNNKLLGQYFGGKGWPFYNMPNTEEPNAPIKIPSGANIFAQSPIKAVRSSYSDGVHWKYDRYMLSSGGTEPISMAMGAAINSESSGTTLSLNPSEDPEKFKFIAKDFSITTDLKPNPLQKDTTITEVKGTQVILSKPLVGPTQNAVFTLTRPSQDYAAGAMIRLWYSWAEYYRKFWKQNTPNAPTAPTNIKGTMALRSATIDFNEAHPELVEGMAVDGPGLTDAMTEKDMHQGKAVILEIASDKKSVIVSQVARSASPADAQYTFSPPEKLLWTPAKDGDPGYPLFTDKFQFPQNQIEKERDPLEFAKQVYLVMASMNQIGLYNNNNICKFMQDVIGANMGFIFDEPAKQSDDGMMVTSMIRDMIKSVLRGVTDFTKYPDVVDQSGNHLSWYPDPAKPTGGMPFNVFNLDPFVWFVHVKLGFSGYGFSVDDDTADIGAGGANRLQITVAGPEGLQNLEEWGIQAPFGPLRNVSCTYSGPDQVDTLYSSIKDIVATPDNNIKIITEGQNSLKNDETVIIDRVNGVPAANGTFKVQHATKYSFEILNAQTGAPIPFSGAYKTTPSPGRWGYPPRPYIETGADLTKVFYRVTGDDALGTFLGTFVSVNGVHQNKEGVKFRVEQLGTTDSGRLILNTPLTNADGTPLPAGTYPFDFFGGVSEKKR